MDQHIFPKLSRVTRIYSRRHAAIAIFFAALSTASFALCEEADTAKKTGESSLEFLNAVSVPAISLKIDGLGEHPFVPQGAKIAGGAFPLTNWKLLVRPRNATADMGEIESELKIQPGSSSTAVIVGDFVIEKGDATKPKPRATILAIAGDFVDPEKPNRLVLINGIPSQNIEVKLDNGNSAILPPLAEMRWTELGSSVEVTAQIDGKSINVPIAFLAPTRSAIVAFYLKDGQPTFMASGQNTLKN